VAVAESPLSSAGDSRASRRPWLCCLKAARRGRAIPACSGQSPAALCAGLQPGPWGRWIESASLRASPNMVNWPAPKPILSFVVSLHFRSHRRFTIPGRQSKMLADETVERFPGYRVDSLWSPGSMFQVPGEVRAAIRVERENGATLSWSSGFTMGPMKQQAILSVVDKERGLGSSHGGEMREIGVDEKIAGLCSLSPMSMKRSIRDVMGE